MSGLQNSGQVPSFLLGHSPWMVKRSLQGKRGHSVGCAGSLTRGRKAFELLQLSHSTYQSLCLKRGHACSEQKLPGHCLRGRTEEQGISRHVAGFTCAGLAATPLHC